MAELIGISAGQHLKAIVQEFQEKGSIYGYPQRKFFRGFPGYDFSLPFHDRIAATPLGPASGPHTQLAQNIVLSFLGGGRIIELKTIQILDQLEIPRPCIYVPNVGYNVEWSQELRLEDSLREYVSAWVLLHWLEALELLEVPRGDPFYRFIFDISVGYDLKGISSAPVRRWLQRIRNAEAEISAAVATLPTEFAHLKKLPISPHIASSATLSTFHGCPRDEIEAIVQHLIVEHDLDVIVKMNPTILGYETVREILHEHLGYRHISLDREAFDNDLQFAEGVEMMRRLQAFAARHGRRVGAKFTNTLVVKNNQQVFSDPVMYLSGAPLHVLAMTAMHRFRSALGQDFHISFSAGIQKKNVANAVRCFMRPITVCTDLLKTGGYTRMFDYFRHLKKAMDQVGVTSLKEFILRTADPSGQMSLAAAGMENARQIVPALLQDPLYQYENNKAEPPKVDSHLVLFDCLTCNKCLPVCPNAANFSIPTAFHEAPVTRLQFKDGQLVQEPAGTFRLEKKFQIANLADFCNECGDCDTYCPEYGGPYIEKPRFFFSQASYRKFASYDGFYLPDANTLVGRLNGQEYRLEYHPEQGSYRWQVDGNQFIFRADNELLEWQPGEASPSALAITTEPFLIFRCLLDGLRRDPGNYPFTFLIAHLAEQSEG